MTRNLTKLLCGAGLLVLLAGAGTAAAQGPPPEPAAPARHLIFANRYRVTDRAGGFNDVVTIGHVDFLDDRTVRIWYLLYDGQRNLQPMAANRRHPNVLGTAGAVPGPVHIPKYVDVQQFRGTYLFDGKLLRVRVGSVLHDWELRDPAKGLYVLRGPYTNAEDGSHVIDGLTHADANGYAYFADRIAAPRPLTVEDLLPSYDGEIDTLARQGERLLGWQKRRTQFNFNRFRPFPGDMLAHAEVSERLNPPSYVFGTVMLNYAPHSNLLLYHSGGHDFNRNAVPDDLGHTTQLFGVWEGGRVEKMVFVEHSYQTRGYPLLSVGHYFNPQPARVAARPALPPAAGREPPPVIRTPEDFGTLPPPRRYDDPPRLAEPPRVTEPPRRPGELVPPPRRAEELAPPPVPAPREQVAPSVPRERGEAGVPGWVWRPREQRWEWEAPLSAPAPYPPR